MNILLREEKKEKKNEWIFFKWGLWDLQNFFKKFLFDVKPLFSHSLGMYVIGGGQFSDYCKKSRQSLDLEHKTI